MLSCLDEIVAEKDSAPAVPAACSHDRF